MVTFNRHLDERISKHFNKFREVMILLGARQTGKTTLLKRLFPKAQYLLVDNEPIKQALESYDVNFYRQSLPSGSRQVIIDEIHLLSNPGRAAKIIYDQMPEVELIITGSSSLNIKNKTAESLAGRAIEYQLFPLTYSEYLTQTGVEKKLNTSIFQGLISTKTPTVKTHLFDLGASLNQVLLFGLYPNLVNHPASIEYLRNLAQTLAFKDIEELSVIEKRRDAANLLKLLAYQIGQLVNYTEISAKLNLNLQTVKRYIDIFEQSFLIYRIYPYSTRKRDEISKSPKIYFVDTGLRNALIDDFSPLSLRPDSGALFENFIINEAIKANRYLNGGYTIYYWRTKAGAEVDLVMEKGKQLLGIEIKSAKSRHQGNVAFKNRYPKAFTKIINKTNFY